MKKMTALIAAAALFAAMCGCNDKDNDNDVTDGDVPHGDVTVSAESTAETPSAGPTVLELTADDFTSVNASVNIISDKLPDAVKSVDISGLDFGSRLSPCKAPDVCDKYGMHYTAGDEELQKSYDEARQRCIETPSPGKIQSAAMLDGKMYFAVNYDDLCGDHDSSVFSYDLKTGELREVAQRTGLEYDCGFLGLTAAHGSLWFYDTVPEEGSVMWRINKLDPESGEYEVFAELGDNLNSSIDSVEETDRGILVHRFAYSSMSEYDEDGYSMYSTEYDADTGEVISETPGFQSPARQQGYTCDGQPAEVTGGFDGERNQPVVIKTQYYTLETGLNSYSEVFLWKDKVCVTFDTVSAHWLYTYDIAKRECVKMNFNGFRSGTLEQAGDGLMCATTATNYGSNSWYVDTHCIYYIVPESGIAYRLQLCDGFISGRNSSICYFATYKAIPEDDLSYNMYGNSYSPDTLYYAE